MTRGYTDEADKILNYLVYASFFSRKPLYILNKHTQEYGIFDALEKNYLQSFIFAIYLVCQDIY
jgi:meiosis-specific protein HOP1